MRPNAIILISFLTISFLFNTQELSAKVNNKTKAGKIHKLIKQVDEEPYVPQSHPQLPLKIYKAVNLSAPVGEVIGTTTFDLQTIHSVCRRIATHPNGRWFYAGWTMDKDFTTSDPNRGTGFNIYDNQTGMWLPQPDFRIEPNTRAGWPTIGFNQDRQFSITAGMLFTWRTGTVNQNEWSEVAVGSIVNDVSSNWARAVTDGSNIYMITGRPFNSEFGGIGGGLNFIRSLDNGDTWESTGSLEEDYSNSIPFNILGDSFAIDAANGIISVVYGASLSEIIMYKSIDKGENWNKTIIQKSSNPLVANLNSNTNNGNVGFTVEPFFGSNGSNTVIIDSDGKSHVVFSGRTVFNTPDNDFNSSDGSFFFDQLACGLFYWNEDMQEPEIIGKTIMNDADGDGILGNNLLTLNTGGQPFYIGFVCHPQLGIDNENNLFVSYTANVDGAFVPEEVSFLSSQNNGNEVSTFTQSFPPDSNTYTDVFMIKSTDEGNSWQGPLNVTNAPLSEETYASIPRNIGDTIMLIYQHDLLPGTFLLYNQQEMPTINEIAAVKILPGDINNDVAPPDSEPYFTAPNLGEEGIHFFLPQGCSLINEEYLGAFAFGMDYPDGIIKDFQIAGLADYNTPGLYTEGIFVEDSQGNISDTAFYNIQVLPDTEPPFIELDDTCTINVYLGGEINLPEPIAIVDFFILESELEESGCDISDNLEITHNIDVESPGIYLVTYSVTDFAGNVFSTTIEVNVLDQDQADTEGPEITVTNLPTEINLTQIDSLSLIQISAVDNVNCTDVTLTTEGLTEAQNATTGGEFDIVVTAIDQSNNSTVETFTIEVIDYFIQNNLCENALFIDVLEAQDCIGNAISIDFSTNTLDMDIDGCGFADVFYQFVVPENGAIRVAANQGSNDRPARTNIYQNCNEEPIFTDECNTDYSTGIISGLNPADTLILQVINTIRFGEYTICIEKAEPTPNNECSNPEFIEVLPFNSELNGKVYTYSNTLNNSNDCINLNTHADSYYSFVVPQTGQIKYVSTNTNNGTSISLYTRCNTNSIFTNCRPDRNELITGLTPGDTLILQIQTEIFGYELEFGIQEVEPTVNNNCNEAILIDVVSPDLCSENIISVDLNYNTSELESSCFSSLMDAYYSFIVPQSGRIKINSESSAFNYALYSTCAGEELFCGTSNEFNIVELNPNDTIILKVDKSRFSDDFADFCVIETPATPNNSCENAIPIEVGQSGNCNSIDIALTYNTLNNPNSCVSSYSDEVDAFYEYTVPPSGLVEITTENYRVNCTGYNACNGEELFCFTNVSQVLLPIAEPGITIFLQVSDRRNEVSFCIAEVLPSLNNSCENAIPIEVGQSGNCNSIDIDLTYNMLNKPNSCVSSYSDEVDAFYKYTVPPSGLVEITTENYRINYTGYNACNGEELFCFTNVRQVLLPIAEPGTTIILQVSSYYRIEDSFCIEEVLPSINNSCENATLIEVGQSGNCNSIDIDLTYNTLNNPNSCVSSYSDEVDAFYEYTVPPSGLVEITTENYRVNCTGYNACNGEELFCFTNVRQVLLPIAEPGTTIILQVSDRRNEVSFCIEEVLLSPNDTCENAIWVSIEEIFGGYNCGVTLNLESNNVDIPTDCSTNEIADAFYKFIVPPSGQIILFDNYNYDDFSIQLFESCNSEPIYCNINLSYDDLVTDLPPGDTLILQIFEDFERVTEFCVYNAIPSPNNNCVDATLVTVGNCSTNTITIDFIFNTKDIETECNSFDRDAFVEYISPESGYVKMFSDNLTINYNQLYTQVSQSCNPALFTCLPVLRNSVFPFQEPGSSNIIQLTTDDSRLFSLCLVEAHPTENNICKNAELIAVHSTYNCNFTTINFSDNTLEKQLSYCAPSSPTVDAFYEFVVPPSGQIIINSMDDFGFALFSDCNDNDNLFCKIRNLEGVLIPNLPVGDTLLMQVYQDLQNEISFCLTEMPCEVDSNVYDIPFVEVFDLDSCTLTSGSLTQTENPLNLDPSCGFGNFNQLYRFIVPEIGQVRITPSSNSIRVALYDNCSLFSIFCSWSSLSSNLIRNFAPGDTVILQIFSNTQQYFTFCIENASSSDNDLCINPTTIGVAPIGECTQQNVTINATNNSRDLSICEINTDVFFEFIAPQNEYIKARLSNQHSLSILNNCNDEEPVFCNNGTEIIIPNLTPFESYIMRVAGNLQTLTICLEEVEPAENDFCESAQPIEIVNSIEQCSSNLISTDLTNNTLENDVSCESGEEVDAYYTFIAPPSGQVILNNLYDVALVIYESCGGQELYCGGDNYETDVVRNLIPGESHVLQIAGRRDRTYEFCISDAPLSPNNLCNNAQPIEVISSIAQCDSNLISVNLTYNTLENEVSCGFGVEADAYYTFIAPPSGQVVFNNISNAVLVVYESCGGQELYCRDYNFETNPVRNLIPGESYILQIAGRRDRTYEFCISDAPLSPNNLCNNAQPIEVISSIAPCDSNLISVNLTNNTLENNVSCYFGEEADAYYTFIAPPSGQVVFNNVSNAALALVVYESCNGQQLHCVDYYFEINPVRNLAPGESYLIQIASGNPNNIEFCLSDAPPSSNNLCENALPLSVGSEESCFNEVEVITTYNTRNSGDGCSSGKDAFFSFVAPENGSVKFIANLEVDFGLFDGCAADFLLCVRSKQELVVTDLIPSQTYILIIFNSSFQNNLTICASEAFPSTNNTCENAILIDVNTQNNCTSNLTLVENEDNNLDRNEDCVRNRDINADAFYKFVVPPSGQIFVNTFVRGNGGFSIFKECGNSSQNTIFTCVTQNYGYYDEETSDFVRNLPIGDTLYLQLFQREPSNFNLCIEEVLPPENNICENAQWLFKEENETCNFTQLNVDLNLYTLQSPQQNNSCYSSSNVDAFYKMIVPEEGIINLESNEAFSLAIYEICNDMLLYCSNSLREHRYTDSMPGDTIILQILDDATTNPFDICISTLTPTENNTCNNPTLLDIQTGLTCIEVNSTLVKLSENTLDVDPFCANGIIADAFYEFVVPESGDVKINSLNSSTRFGVAIYKGCNSNVLYCNDSHSGYSGSIPNLTPNDTLILQIFEDMGVDFSICILDASPSENNTC